MADETMSLRFHLVEQTGKQALPRPVKTAHDASRSPSPIGQLDPTELAQKGRPPRDGNGEKEMTTRLGSADACFLAVADVPEMGLT